MKFEKNKMYYNLLKDSDMAFIVDEVLSDNHTGADLIVSWYKLSGSRYVSTGINGEFHIPKWHIAHYMEV